VAAAVAAFTPIHFILYYHLWSPGVPFVFMFIGGIFADLLETRRRKLVMWAGTGLLLVSIVTVWLMAYRQRRAQESESTRVLPTICDRVLT